ncbi:hypothetical protein LCGC14_2072680 [marine sediment metagenome]|uniref:AAA+ ATPase domain-containing protein n=1 Tax=marine sediment metagenome TaxID=412755 RepID=A0A0F9GWA1_9ZZZZ
MNETKADVTLPAGETKTGPKANLNSLIPGGCPFKETDGTHKRVKAFLWGGPGAGKTTLALQFPGVALIDMEGGSRLYDDAFKFKRFPATEADEVMAAVDWLLANQHPFRTLVIDPMTIYWEALQTKYREIFLKRNKKSAGFKFEFYQFQPGDWIIVKAEMKELMRKLMRLDMNVIVTARDKTKYEEGTSEMMKKTGDQVFDVERSMPFFFDVVLRLTRGPKGEFLATCLKERSPKDAKGVFTEGTEFVMEYKLFEKMFGAAALKKESKPVDMVSTDTKGRIESLIEKLGLDEAQVTTRLSAYGANNMDGLTVEAAATILGKLEAAVKSKEGGSNG